MIVLNPAWMGRLEQRFGKRALGDCQDRQRPATRDSGGWPIVLMIGSHPSSNSGLGVGARGALISIGLLMALRLMSWTNGKRSPLSIRLIPAGLRSTDVAAVVEETSSPMMKDANPKAAPQQATRYRE
jgi:hypothetical protein